MDRVIQALRAYDQQIWQEFHQLKQPPEEKRKSVHQQACPPSKCICAILGTSNGNSRCAIPNIHPKFFDHITAEEIRV